MPKDRERYRYIDVGLERDSWTLAMFEEDARRHQMSDQPGKLITLRLTEYYEMKKEREMPSFRETVPVGNERPALQPAYDQRTNNHGMRAQGCLQVERCYTTKCWRRCSRRGNLICCGLDRSIAC